MASRIRSDYSLYTRCTVRGGGAGPQSPPGNLLLVAGAPPEAKLPGRRRWRAIDDALDGLLEQAIVLLGPGVEDAPLD